MNHDDYWKRKLTPFDFMLCNMVASLTGEPCEPKNGDDHYFFEANYKQHNDPIYILAIWDAIDGAAGERLISIKDDPDRTSLFVCVKFHSGPCEDAAFVPVSDSGKDD